MFALALSFALGIIVTLFIIFIALPIATVLIADIMAASGD